MDHGLVNDVLAERLDLLARRIDEMRSRNLKKEELVVKVRKLLRDIKPIIGKDSITVENVQKVNKLTTDTVNAITSEDQ